MIMKVIVGDRTIYLYIIIHLTCVWTVMTVNFKPENPGFQTALKPGFTCLKAAGLPGFSPRVPFPFHHAIFCFILARNFTKPENGKGKTPSMWHLLPLRPASYPMPVFRVNWLGFRRPRKVRKAARRSLIDLLPVLSLSRYNKLCYLSYLYGPETFKLFNSKLELFNSILDKKKPSLSLVSVFVMYCTDGVKTELKDGLYKTPR